MTVIHIFPIHNSHFRDSHARDSHLPHSRFTFSPFVIHILVIHIFVIHISVFCYMDSSIEIRSFVLSSQIFLIVLYLSTVPMCPVSHLLVDVALTSELPSLFLI